jgi:hypothetical protein
MKHKYNKGEGVACFPPSQPAPGLFGRGCKCGVNGHYCTAKLSPFQRTIILSHHLIKFQDVSVKI